eukprot:TRINITY_DN6386_c0_g2_i1.p1 TRINITY_DN6386_c0_g2~~TRINITY_DN6386_c0_g2_i1.p1  ORF type:complete len:484 (-),score=41.74 TRINITY_DN6386_c0_g2_i1:33-1448(-)
MFAAAAPHAAASACAPSSRNQRLACDFAGSAVRGRPGRFPCLCASTWAAGLMFRKRRVARSAGSCYEVLGISKDASEQDIKRAYKKLTKQYHPDVNRAPDATERFQEIKEAYEAAAQGGECAQRFGQGYYHRPPPGYNQQPPPQARPEWRGGHLGIADVTPLKKQKWDCKWSGAVAIDGVIYAAPLSQDRVLIYDTRTGALDGADASEFASWSWNWEGAVEIDGKVYCVPRNAENLLIFDPSTGLCSGVNVSDITGCTLHRWGGTVKLNGKVYGVPYDADELLVYNPRSGKARGIDCLSVAQGPNKWRGGVAFDGKLYCAPYCSDRILVYDPSSGQVSGIEIPQHDYDSEERQWGGAVELNGKIYFVPFDSDKLLIFDPRSQEFEAVAVGHLGRGSGKWFGGLVLNGKVCCIPANAKQVLVYDPRTGDAIGADVSAYHSCTKWFGGVAVNGRGYGIPFDADHMLVFSCERL